MKKKEEESIVIPKTRGGKMMIYAWRKQKNCINNYNEVIFSKRLPLLHIIVKTNMDRDASLTSLYYKN